MTCLGLTPAAHVINPLGGAVEQLNQVVEFKKPFSISWTSAHNTLVDNNTNRSASHYSVPKFEYG